MKKILTVLGKILLIYFIAFLAVGVIEMTRFWAERKDTPKERVQCFEGNCSKLQWVCKQSFKNRPPIFYYCRWGDFMGEAVSSGILAMLFMFVALFLYTRYVHLFEGDFVLFIFNYLFLIFLFVRLIKRTKNNVK